MADKDEKIEEFVVIQWLDQLEFLRECLMDVWLKEGPYTSEYSSETKSRMYDFFEWDDSE